MLATVPVLFVLLAAASGSEPERSARPAFDELWDHSDPAASESAFRAALPSIIARGDVDRHAQLLSQIARTLGLRERFADAHARLDEAEALLGGASGVASVRIALERGRLHNSARQLDQARPLFVSAFERAQALGLEFLSVDAAHMLAIVARGEDAITWNRKALALAAESHDRQVQGWAASLYQNLGYALQEQEQHEQALAVFERGLAFCEQHDRSDRALIMRWFIGRTQRSLGLLEPALATQTSLLAAYDANPAEDDPGYAHEEAGECLWALGRREEARPYLAEAHRRLSKLAWLEKADPKRLASLAERAAGETER